MTATWQPPQSGQSVSRLCRQTSQSPSPAYHVHHPYFLLIAVAAILPLLRVRIQTLPEVADATRGGDIYIHHTQLTTRMRLQGVRYPVRLVIEVSNRVFSACVTPGSLASLVSHHVVGIDYQQN